MHKHSQLIFDKDVKNTQWEKDNLFNKRYRGNDINMQKNKIGSISYTLTETTQNVKT